MRKAELSAYVFIRSIYLFLKKYPREEYEKTELYDIYRVVYYGPAVTPPPRGQYNEELNCIEFETAYSMLHNLEKVKMLKEELLEGLRVEIAKSELGQEYLRIVAQEYNDVLSEHVYSTQSYNEALKEFNMQKEEEALKKIDDERKAKLEEMVRKSGRSSSRGKKKTVKRIYKKYV